MPLPLPAADEEELRRNLPGAVAALSREVQALQGGAGAAYVHCNGGRGRAPTVVVAFLYWLAGLSLEEAAATMTAGERAGMMGGGRRAARGATAPACHSCGARTHACHRRRPTPLLAAGRDSKPKLPVIAAATADLLGAPGQSKASLAEEERAAVKAALAALA